MQNFVEQKFSTPLGKYQGPWLLAHMARVCSVSSETAISFSSVMYHFASTLAMNESFWCSTSLVGFGDVSVLDLAMLIDVKWYFIVILIFISLIAYDVEYTFISPLVICICSLHIQRCLLRSLVHFLYWVFCFLFVVFFFFLFVVF